MPPKSTTGQAAAPNDQRPAKQSGAKNAYLLAYNAVSAALWAGVLYQTVTIGGNEVVNAQKAGAFFGKGDWFTAIQRGLSSAKVYDNLEYYTRVVQSLAGLEVLHSLLGMSINKGENRKRLTHRLGVVRAPLLTTLMQVASRFLLVHLIASPSAFPFSTRHSPAYTTMLLAWSVTEVIRYSYFVFSLSGAGVPAIWTWLRYNTFLVLYPLGIASECWLVYQAIPLASQRNELFGYALWAILAIYVPGSYILFSHMLAQRRKIARQSKKA
jgi:very-long-chain (3R)-3-hydroxyacyl-CoA dehydratase